MTKTAMFGALVALLSTFALPTQAQDAGEATLRREVDLLKREVDLLKREVELLRKENEQLKEAKGKAGADKAGGGAKVTVDDLEYEFVSLRLNGAKGELRLAVTSKKGSKEWSLFA